MPKTRNYSKREKRDAMDLLDIHDDISVVHMITGINQRTLRRWRKKLRRQQNATLSEKDISLSAKRTMSDKVQTRPQPLVSPVPKPSALQLSADAAIDKSNEANENFQTLLHIRDQLLRFARRLTDDLDPDDPDVNLRTLSLARTLDRIYWLDETLYPSDEEEEQPDNAAQPNRIEFVYEGAAHEHPPWHDAPQEYDA